MANAKINQHIELTWRADCDLKFWRWEQGNDHVDTDYGVSTFLSMNRVVTRATLEKEEFCIERVINNPEEADMDRIGPRSRRCNQILWLWTEHFVSP